ncbi:hypothetical protein HPC62_19165 [Thermoleptolyngbya sichuanensis A183]|uniref:Uncharacterized protein n=1 Tax=Thermoleptolyngbya sichuanensis A183 TaxID=2737172 RepID=A0A6M8BI01_9CYAN|nr:MULTISPECIES: hypothetical protein [Thermoleptolyngbya]QKD84026.1 hypothetical protein HPC62_19165 [Thermoleptolyngbya sichuanensis A183]
MSFGKLLLMAVVIGFVSISKCADGIAQDRVNSEQSSQVDAEPSELEVRLSGKELYDALVSQTVSELDRLAREREALRWTIVSIITALLVGAITVAGVAGYKDLQKKIYAQLKDEININESIKAAIEENVRKVALSRIDEKVEQLNKEFAFYKFSNLASDLSDKSRDSFSNAERDAVMEVVDIIKDSKEITSRPEFLASLEKVVDVFISADLDDYIDDLEGVLEAIIGRYPGIVYSLMNQYGMRVLGDTEVSDATKARFFKYAYACKHHRIWEIALPWLMVYEFSNQLNGWEKKIEEYFIDAQQLNPNDKQRFLDVFERYTDPSRYRRSTGQIIRFTCKFQEFIKHYEEKIAALNLAAST